MITYKPQNKNNKMSILSAFSTEEIEAVIVENPNLRGYLQGYLAEVALKKQILQLEHVSSVTKIPDHDLEKGDLKIMYRGIPITIEVKSIQTDSVREDILNDTWQGRVTTKSSDKREIEVEGLGLIRSSSLKRGEFDILGISCYAISETWEFLFMENQYMPSTKTSSNLLKSSFIVNPETTPCLFVDLSSVLESVYLRKTDVKIEHD